MKKHDMNMKKSLHVIGALLVTVALLCQSNPMSAATKFKTPSRQRTQVEHLITAGASVGYSTLLENYDDLETIGKVGGTFGVGYELHFNKFLFSAGLEAQYVTADATFELPDMQRKIIDTQGKPATMNYAFEPVEEAHRLLYVSIPVMVGTYYEGFYFGLGAKVGLAVSPMTNMNVKYETSGIYGEYIDDFSGMLNNGYGSSKYISGYKNEKMPIRGSVIAEIGYDVLDHARKMDNRQRNGLRIAAVCEYGLNNTFNTKEPAESVVINKDNANDVTVLPYYQSHDISGHRVSNLYAGIKVTWTFSCSPTGPNRVIAGPNHVAKGVRNVM